MGEIYRFSNVALAWCVFQRATEARCLLLSVVPINEPCPWMLSPWVEEKGELEEGWLAEEMSPVPRWSNRRTWKLPFELGPFPTDFQEAWVCVHREAIQQVT